jgi:hypothetical protein
MPFSGESRDHDRDPSGDRDPIARGRLPNSRYRTFRPHNAVPSNGRLRRARGSSSPNANDTGFLPDNNIRRPRNTPAPEPPASL